MISVRVKIRYNSTGGTPNAQTNISLSVESKTESAVSAAIKKRNPKWNFIILEII